MALKYLTEHSFKIIKSPLNVIGLSKGDFYYAQKVTDKLTIICAEQDSLEKRVDGVVHTFTICNFTITFSK